MGEIVTNPPSTPNTVSDSWQPLLDVNTMSYYGLNRVTLTNWDSSTTLPQVAQGSAIDIDGSIARFTTDEAIGGSPADGVVYLKFVVSGAVVTPELTATAPTWYADKAGWYNVSGERYSGHRMTKAGAVYTKKTKLRDDPSGAEITIGPHVEIDADDVTVASSLTSLVGVTTDNFAVRAKLLSTTASSSGKISIAHGISSGATVIKGFRIMYEYTTGQWHEWPAGSTNVYITGTTVVSTTSYFATENKAVRIILWYEA